MSSSPRARDRSSYGWAVLLVALSLEAFGGLVLLLQTANGMLSATEEPLAMRLSIFIALLIAWGATAAILFSATYLYKLLGARALTALERLMGMLLVAISVQMFLDGISTYLRSPAAAM